MRPIQGAAGRSPLAPRTSSLRVMVLSAHSGGSDSWGNNPAWRSEHEHTREGRRAEYKARWAQAMEAARREHSPPVHALACHGPVTWLQFTPDVAILLCL